MNNLFKKASIIIICLIISSCTVIQRHPDNNSVRLVFYNELNLSSNPLPECKYLGAIVSSEGHWYDYLFISNTELANGAINDMYNKANKIGANVVYINNNIDFVTSVTLLGQAYDCDSDTVRWLNVK